MADELPISITLDPRSAEQQLNQFVGRAKVSLQQLNGELERLGKSAVGAGRGKTPLEVSVENDDKAIRKMIAIYDQAKREDAAFEKARNVYAQAGLKSPIEQVAAINAQKTAQKALHDELKAGSLSLATYNDLMRQSTAKLAQLEEGNSRARGAVHQLGARLASLTFEMTGAIYGLTAIAGLVGGPALFGARYLKSIEDAKMGMVGTLITMGQFEPGADKFKTSMAVAESQIKSLEDQSIRFGIPLNDIVDTFRAVVGSGLQAGMTLEEVGKFATVGAVAVRSLGLNSTQTVQELRDLAMGGIQPASSTLATSLGLRDSDIKKAKQDAANGIKSFYDFLMEKLAGYNIAAAERANTMSGAFDILTIKLQRTFADAGIFDEAKRLINSISDSIGTLDKETGNLKIREEVIQSVKIYSENIQQLIGWIGSATSFAIEHGKAIGQIIFYYTAAKTTLFVINGISTAWVAATGAIAASAAAQKAATLAAEQTTVAVSSTTLAYQRAAMAAESSAAVQATAMTSVANAAKGAVAGVGAIVGKAGLVGMALFMAYEAADYLGIIDAIFGGAEKRAKKLQESLKGMSSESLQGRLQDLKREQKQISDAMAANTSKTQATMVDVEGTPTNAVVRAQQVASEISAIERQIATTAKSSDVSFEQSDSNRIKALEEFKKHYKSRETILSEYKLKFDQIDRLIKAEESSVFEPNPNKSAADNAEDARKNKEISDKRIRDFKDVKDMMAAEQANALKSLDKPAKALDKVAFGEADRALKELYSKYKPQEVVNEAFDNQIDLLNKYIGIAEKTGRKFEVAPGTNLDAKQLREVLGLIQETKKARDEAYDANLRNIREQATLGISGDIQKMQQEMALMGQGGTARQELDASLNYQQRLIEMTKAYEKERKAQGADQSKINSEEKAAQEDLLRIYEQQIGVIRQLYDYQRDGWNGAQEALNKYHEEAGNRGKQVSDMITRGLQGMEDAIVKFATTGKLSFKDLFATMYQEYVRNQVKMAMSQATGSDGILSSLFNWGKNILGGGGGVDNGAGWWSQNSSSVGQNSTTINWSNIPVQAFGGAWDLGIQKFAMGGAFTNSVVTEPTMFKFAKGTGLMGEAGPEAIMPLVRGPSGHLGVRAQGAAIDNAQPSVVVQQTYTIDARGADAGVEQKIQLAMARTKQETLAAVNDSIRRGGSIGKSMRK